MFITNTTRVTGIKAHHKQSTYDQAAYMASQSGSGQNFSSLHLSSDQITIRFGMYRKTLEQQIKDYRAKIRDYEHQIEQYESIRNLSLTQRLALARQEDITATKYKRRSGWHRYHSNQANWYRQVSELSTKVIDNHITKLDKEYTNCINFISELEDDLDTLSRKNHLPPYISKAPINYNADSSDDFRQHHPSKGRSTTLPEQDYDNEPDPSDDVSRGKSRKPKPKASNAAEREKTFQTSSATQGASRDFTVIEHRTENAGKPYHDPNKDGPTDSMKRRSRERAWYNKD